METNQEDSFLHMHLDYDGGNILQETARWSRFLSIVGIVGLAFFALVFALAGAAAMTAFSTLAPGLASLEGIGGAILIVFLLAFFAVLGFLVYMLYRFSVLTRRGIDQQDQAVFSEGMKCLKTYFLISGIIALLGIALNLYSVAKLFIA